MAKNSPADSGDSRARDSSLGWEGALGKEMAIRSSIFAWKIPWTEGSDGYSPGVAKFQHTRKKNSGGQLIWNQQTVGFSVHETSQARILERVDISFCTASF